MCVALLTRSAAKSFDLLAVKEAALLNVEGNRFIPVQQYTYQDLQSIQCSKEKQKLTGFFTQAYNFDHQYSPPAQTDTRLKAP